MSNLGWRILYFLYYEVEHFKTEVYPLINKAARLEVERHWAIAAPFGPGIKPCIWLFCRTISGNPGESAHLIRRMLTPEELVLSGYFRGHEVANEIVSVARSLPDLAVEVYERLYSYREMGAEQVPMGSSAVLPMSTSRHDMYSSAYYNLQKGLTEIFDFSPKTATRAVCKALGGSEHYKPYDETSRLLTAWCDCVRKLPGSAHGAERWKEVADALAEETVPLDLWATLLTAVLDDPSFFQGVIWPVLHSPDLLSCWHLKKHIDPCVQTLAKTADYKGLGHWQQTVLALTPDDLRRHNYSGNPDALEKLKSSYLLCLPEAALTKAAREFLARCKPENVNHLLSSEPSKPAPDEQLLVQHRHAGIDPNNPLHLQLEKELASLRNQGPKNMGPSILKRIRAIEARFSEADNQLQSRLRDQFQDGFAWALLQLGRSATELTAKQLHEMLDLCEGLLETHSGRNHALEAIGLALSRKRSLSSEQRNLLQRVVSRSEPEVIERFGYYIWGFLRSWPEFVWSTLDHWTTRMDEPEVGKGLRYALHDCWFWWLFRAEPERALALLEKMLSTARRVQNAELADDLLAWFAAVVIDENNARCRATLEAALSQPEIHATEFDALVQVLVNWLMPRAPKGKPPADKLQRASALAQSFFNAAHEALERWHRERRAIPEDKRPTEATPWVKSIAQQFDRFGTELEFSADAHVKALAGESPVIFKNVADAWWESAEPLLAQLEKWLHPHFGHSLVKVLAEWLPHYPARCLHWLHRLCEAGKRTNFLFEQLVTADVISILQRCLAEHRDLLGSEKSFLQDFAAVLEALLSTASAEALGMAASLDEFYR